MGIGFVGNAYLIAWHLTEHAAQDGLRQKNAQTTANHSQRKALDQELAKDARAGCALRHAHSDFLLTSSAPGEQEIGDVHTGDQQYEADRAHHQPQAGSGILRKEVILQRFDGDGDSVVGLRIILREAPGDDGHLRIGIGEGDAWLQATKNQQKMAVAVHFLWSQRQGNDDVGVAVVGRAGGRHADHGVGLATHAQHLADNVRVASELFAPEAVVQNDDVFLAELSVFGKEVPSKRGLLSDQLVKETRGDP